jgi:DNA-binding MarR family transcriptional regulator
MIDYNGSKNVTYDIYLGKNLPLEMINKGYPDTYYKLNEDLEDGEKYYWKVVPRIGELTGQESDIWWFKIDKGIVIPEFGIEIQLEKTKLVINQGSEIKLLLFVKNIGNIRDTFNIDINGSHLSNVISIFINYPIIQLNPNENCQLVLTIIIPIDIIPANYFLSIEVRSLKAIDYGLEIEKTENLSIQVLKKPDNGKKTVEEDSTYNFLLISVIILIILITFVFNRIEKSKVLANIQRKAIYEVIKKNPSIHFRAVMRTLSLKPGTLSYHLNVLEKEGYIKSIQKGEYRCFYTAGTKSDFKIVLTKLQQKILFIINENPGISLTELSNAVGRNKMVLHYNTHILEDAGVIKQEKRGRSSTYYTTSVASLYMD